MTSMDLARRVLALPPQLPIILGAGCSAVISDKKSQGPRRVQGREEGMTVTAFFFLCTFCWS